MGKIQKGTFITFEGIDTSGKSTQAELLAETLEKEGCKVKLFHFPMYERPIGKLIGDILNGRVKSDIGNDAMQMLYVADQISFQEELKKYIDDGYTVICDRYDLSTIVYYSMMPGKTLANAMDTVYKRWQVGLVKPDVSIIFNLNAEEIAKRKKILDKFEKNTEAMTKANENYLTLALNLSDRRRFYVDASQSIRAISKSIESSILGYIKRR